MWGKLHRELIVITIISVLILAVSFAFNFSAIYTSVISQDCLQAVLTSYRPYPTVLNIRQGKSVPFQITPSITL